MPEMMPAPSTIGRSRGRRRAAVIVAAVAAAITAGCTASGPAGDPITRSFTWFDYVGGGNLARSCAPGIPDRYRLVYNAVFPEQVRTYDLVTREDNRGRLSGSTLVTTVWERANLAKITASRPGAPWGPTESRTDLGAAQTAALIDRLAAGGGFKPAPAGERLHSLGFYWTVARCQDGRFGFWAAEAPDPAFTAFHPQMLFSIDGNPVPPREPRPVVTNPPIRSQDGGLVNGHQPFELTVSKNGLVGVDYDGRN